MARRHIAVNGIVQGVGFRPFVHQLATRLGLGGFVCNQQGGVRIEVEGIPELLDEFVTKLSSQSPPLAKIHGVACVDFEPRDEPVFCIKPSEPHSPSSVFIGADIATCDACLAELSDPADRRFRYPFLNCTNCGPRLTMIRAAPYDRERTTMAGFRLCRECKAEYDDPANRRFHAQATACPFCGPRLMLLGARLAELPNGVEPLAGVVAGLQRGWIIALKGLGGYHLACDATNAAMVSELRRRKARDDKPFALMVANVALAETLCVVAPAERELLQTGASFLLKEIDPFTFCATFNRGIREKGTAGPSRRDPQSPEAGHSVFGQPALQTPAGRLGNQRPGALLVDFRWK